MPIVQPPDAERQFQAYRAGRRLGGGLARVIQIVWKRALADLPDSPTEWDYRHWADTVARAVAYLQKTLPKVMADELRKMAYRYHLRAAKVITRQANKFHEDEFTDALDAISDYANLIINPPTFAELQKLVGPASPMLSKWFDPQATSDKVLYGVSQGWDRRQIVKELANQFGGYETAARRIARTQGLHVATQTQLAVSESIPGMVVGYRIFAVDDGHSPTSREEHKERHGRRYYREPKFGQRGLNEMPQPPFEANGTIAYNCRCFLVPLIDGDEG